MAEMTDLTDAPILSVEPFVTVVSGTSGGGKSTLIRHLEQRMPDAVLRLHFDDYAHLGNDPQEIAAWLERGADPNEIETPELVRDLERLRAGYGIERAAGSRILEPKPVILVEEPFGSSRRTMAPLFDWALHLELPPDVALARRLVRGFDGLGQDADGERDERERLEELMRGMHHDLQAYLAVGRRAYQAAEDAARAEADRVLDGMRPVAELTGDVMDELRRRLSRDR